MLRSDLGPQAQLQLFSSLVTGALQAGLQRELGVEETAATLASFFSTAPAPAPDRRRSRAFARFAVVTRADLADRVPNWAWQKAFSAPWVRVIVTGNRSAVRQAFEEAVMSGIAAQRSAAEVGAGPLRLTVVDPGGDVRPR